MMTTLRTIALFVFVLALLCVAGCTQQDATKVPVSPNPSPTSTTVPVDTPTSVLTVQTVPSAPVTSVATSRPTIQASQPAIPSGTLKPGDFTRYTGAEYSLDYPASWLTNRTVLPLREYRHELYECTATFAYNLDQELRMFSSRDGSTIFYAGIVHTDRDIWPRQGNEVVYEDIVNSYLGYPAYCANLKGNEAFRINGISQVPLEGVLYTGVRADFSRINRTGFRVGSGTAYVVTGKNHRGVFLFYSTRLDPDTQANLSEYMFDSLKLDTEF